MRTRRTGPRAAASTAAVLVVLSGSVVAGPPAARAQSPSGLAVSVPATASLGSAPVGARTLSGALGPVTVSTTGGLVGSTSWTATVSTSGFTTGAGTAPERVEPAAVRYRSGAATAASGLSLSACTPGSAVVAVDLAAVRTAFSCGGVSLLTSTSVTWNPVVQVTVSDSNVAGTYTGTVVHSVA